MVLVLVMAAPVSAATDAPPLQVLVVFRTFGSDMPSMFELCVEHGHGDAIAKDGAGAPLVWTMLHTVTLALLTFVATAAVVARADARAAAAAADAAARADALLALY